MESVTSVGNLMERRVKELTYERDAFKKRVDEMEWRMMIVGAMLTDIGYDNLAAMLTRGIDFGAK